MLKTLVIATALLIGVGLTTPLTAQAAWNYAGHITAVSPTSLTVFDKQFAEYHTLAYDKQTAISHWIRERPFVRPPEVLTPDALQFGGLVRVRLRGGGEPVADTIEVASDVKTTFSGRVKAFDDTSLSVYNDDMGVVTLKYGNDTAFIELFTVKPWVRGPVRLSSGELRVGGYVIMHSKGPGTLTIDRVEIARVVSANTVIEPATEAARHRAEATALRAAPTASESKRPGSPGTALHCDRIADRLEKAARTAK